MFAAVHLKFLNLSVTKPISQILESQWFQTWKTVKMSWTITSYQDHIRSKIRGFLKLHQKKFISFFCLYIRSFLLSTSFFYHFYTPRFLTQKFSSARERSRVTSTRGELVGVSQMMTNNHSKLRRRKEIN